MTAELLLSIDEVRQLYVQGDSAHDFDHVLRVLGLAERLADAEGADEVVVRYAALLHDVPVRDDAETALVGRQAHHLTAAAYAGQLLAARGMGTDQVASVVHCIEAHRFRDQTIQPQTLEAKCLYDADKLDSIGAIGIARACAYAGSHGHRLWTETLEEIPPIQSQPSGANYTPVHEFVYKLTRIVDSLYTPSARRIGEGRHAFMQEYFSVLEAEVLGER